MPPTKGKKHILVIHCAIRSADVERLSRWPVGKVEEEIGGDTAQYYKKEEAACSIKAAKEELSLDISTSLLVLLPALAATMRSPSSD